jgi:hypothetical protein
MVVVVLEEVGIVLEEDVVLDELEGTAVELVDDVEELVEEVEEVVVGSMTVVLVEGVVELVGGPLVLVVLAGTVDDGTVVLVTVLVDVGGSVVDPTVDTRQAASQPSVAGGSHSSPVSITPSPQPAVVQLVRHASGSSSLLLVPLSQRSPATCTPSPHTCTAHSPPGPLQHFVQGFMARLQSRPPTFRAFLTAFLHCRSA